MAERPPLPISVLREAIAYNEATGELIWKRRPLEHFPHEKAAKAFNNRFPGTLALTAKHQGYRCGAISYKGIRYNVEAHRVAFAIAHGRWPEPCADHVNGIRDDNRLMNLREATKLQNAHNKGPMPNNRLGIKGVHRSLKRFTAHAQHNGKRVDLGTYDTLEEAVDARRAFASKHFGVYCRH